MWIRSAFDRLTWRSRSQWFVAVLIAAAVGGAALYATQPRPLTPLLAPSNEPDPLQTSEIQTILPPDAIGAIDHPEFVAADRAGMRDNVNVIGVELHGEAHAFPIPFMSRVEIVNDRLGGTNIAVTW